MMEVAIQIGRRKYRRFIPETWRETPTRKRRIWWQTLLRKTEASAGLMLVLKDILHIPRRSWRRLSAEDRAALTERLSWMTPAPGCEDLPITHFRHRWRTYYLPRPRFENGSCLEFVLADGYYKALMETGDPEQLLLLVATLCRPRKWWRKERLESGDERVTLTQKEEVVARAKRLKALDPAILSAVLLYFEGVKVYVHDLYWMLFDSNPAQPEQEPEEGEASNGPKFGWWSIFLQVAKTGLFGQYEEVLQRRLHKICMHLVDENDLAEKHRDEMDRLRRRSQSNTNS